MVKLVKFSLNYKCVRVCVCVCARASTPNNFVRTIFEISLSSVSSKFFTPTKLIALSRNQTKMTSSSSLAAEKVATFASVTGVEDQSTSRRILKVCVISSIRVCPFLCAREVIGKSSSRRIIVSTFLTRRPKRLFLCTRRALLKGV